MTHAYWLLAALAAGTPLSAQTGATAYEQGVAARRAGDSARAATLLEQAVREKPASADAWVQLGYAHLALGKLDAAEGSFGGALRLAPTYDDARIGQALVAERRGAFDRARTLIAPVVATNADANLLRQRLAALPAERRWALDVDVGATRLGRGQPDWRQLDVQLGHRLDSGAALAGRIEAARRFGRNDLYGEVRGEIPVGAGRSIYLLAGGSPRADFRPRWQVGAGGRVRAVAGATPTVLTLDLRHASYRSGKTTSINPGIEQYLFAGKAWLTFRSINLVDGGDLLSGALGRIDVQASDRLRLFGGAANAPDVDQGIVSRTRSLFAGASVGVDDRIALRLSVSRDRPSIGASRTGVSVGTSVQF